MARLRVIVLALVAAVLCGCGNAGPATSAPSAQESHVQELGVLQKKPLNDYTWSELAEISSRIAAATSDEEGRSIAHEFGLVDDAGKLSDQTKQIVLNETRALDVRLAGIRHDNKSDGTGKAGLTFMTVGALDIRPMNDVATVEGGWEASALRNWLNGDATSMFEKELVGVIVPVNKLTNNVGLTESFDSITETSDKLWVPSVHEVCGDVTWDIEEFRQRRGYEDVDGLLNVEGDQYEVFAQAGVTGSDAAGGFLSLAASTGPSPWWYRTPYPFEWHNLGPTGNDGFFYRVMDSGYPESIGSPEDPSSVVTCFCV
jgi:hypothetical protein